jgi:hypothetical protein
MKTDYAKSATLPQHIDRLLQRCFDLSQLVVNKNSNRLKGRGCRVSFAYMRGHYRRDNVHELQRCANLLRIAGVHDGARNTRRVAIFTVFVNHSLQGRFFHGLKPVGGRDT